MCQKIYMMFIWTATYWVEGAFLQNGWKKIPFIFIDMKYDIVVLNFLVLDIYMDILKWFQDHLKSIV